MSELSVASIVGQEGLADRLSPDGAAEALRRRLRRLALDVHDGPMQSLIAAGYGVRDLQRQLEVNPGSLADRLDQIAEELAGAEQSLRDLIIALERGGERRLDSLDEIGVAEVERFKRFCPIHVELSGSPDAYPDSHSQEIAIRSVLREALNNVAKHANARTVCIQVDANPSGIRLKVTDDGNGFDPDLVPAGRIGIASMRERLQFLSGTLTIESKPGGPTTVTATFNKWHGGAPA